MATKQTFKVKCKSKLQLGQWRCFTKSLISEIFKLELGLTLKSLLS